MGGVGDEAALAVEGAGEALDHVVERVRQLLDLVVRAVEVDARDRGAAERERAAGDPADGLGDAVQRPQHPLGHEVAEGEGHHPHQAECQRTLLEHRPERVGAELARHLLRPLNRQGGRAGSVRRDVGRRLRHPADVRGEPGRAGEALLHQEVRHPEQHDAGEEEQRAVQQGQPDPDRGPQPGAQGMPHGIR